MSVVESSILWSSLSNAQKEQGVHPAQLGSIKFNIEESELSPNMLQRLERFFLGCRMAASSADFLSKSIVHLHPNEQSPQPMRSNLEQTIQGIVERVLLVQLPQENRLKDDPWVKHYQPMQSIFDAHNRMVESGRCYLMHPARRSELIQSLGTTCADEELTADLLITFRCFGYEALRLSMNERHLQENMNEWEQIHRELSALSKKGPQLITHPMALQEEDLVFIKEEKVRKYVCLAYRELASKGKLEILNLPREELFDRGSLKAHPCLDSLRKNYYETGPLCEFFVVIDYLKPLINHDLNALRKFHLTLRLNRVDEQIDFYNKVVEVVKKNSEHRQRLLKEKPEDYNPGNFSFLLDPVEVRSLTDAYLAVDELKEWPFFDQDLPPKNTAYIFGNDPTLMKIAKAMHPEVCWPDSMLWMQSIRRKGWNAVVRENLEQNAERAGVLNRAWLIKTISNALTLFFDKDEKFRSCKISFLFTNFIGNLMTSVAISRNTPQLIHNTDTDLALSSAPDLPQAELLASNKLRDPDAAKQAAGLEYFSMLLSRSQAIPQEDLELAIHAASTLYASTPDLHPKAHTFFKSLIEFGKPDEILKIKQALLSACNSRESYQAYWLCNLIAQKYHYYEDLCTIPLEAACVGSASQKSAIRCYAFSLFSNLLLWAPKKSLSLLIEIIVQESQSPDPYREVLDILQQLVEYGHSQQTNEMKAFVSDRMREEAPVLLTAVANLSKCKIAGIKQQALMLKPRVEAKVNR